MSPDLAISRISRTGLRPRLRFGVALGLSALAHGLIAVWLLLGAGPAPEAMRDPAAIPVALAPWPRLLPRPAPPSPPATPEPAEPAPPKGGAHDASVRRSASPAPTQQAAPEAPDAPAAPPALGEGDLAGAEVAGERASGGGGCGMAERLQAALRSDPLAREAVAGLGGQRLLVWDGDWTWVTGAEGKGLPAVRQALMWEVADAPAACRGEAVRGLVVLSVPASAGPVRLALGAPSWRWSDLLIPRGP